MRSNTRAGSASTVVLPLRRNPVFLRLFAAQLASLLGSGVTSVALAAFAYELAGRDATIIVGTALTLRILAFVLFAPAAGILADRVDRRRLLVGADLLRVALMGAFPFITAVWHVYVLIFLLNAVTAFFTPAFEASIPEVAGESLYTRALAWSRVAVDLEAAGGPLVAGVLIALVGVKWTFWFDGLTYLVSALLVWSTRVPRAPRPTSPFPWGRVWGEATLGTRILLREPALRRALVLHFAEATAGACAIVATVAYVHDVLGLGNTAFALTMTALGIGSSVAAVIASRRSERSGTPSSSDAAHTRYHRWGAHAMLGGGCLLALALLPGIFRPGIAFLAALWALNGAGQALIAVSSVGILAAHTEASERGRAYAAHFALTHLFWLVTYPAVGYMARYIGAPRTFTVAGIAVLVLLAVSFAVGRGTHRHGAPAAAAE
jgi:MFS transporter, NRE family, putaive nickel resistance protein